MVEQQKAEPNKPDNVSTVWDRIRLWDNKLTIAKRLTIVTLLGSYFQYLNAYEDKVSAQAKTDMTDATTTFVDISNAFAEAQTLQQLVFFNFKDSLDKSDAEKEMVTKTGTDVYPDYVKARNTLREKSNVFARKAELYIDWASDLGRDPATKRDLNSDPLTETLLGNYNFDCDATANLPHRNVKSQSSEQQIPGQDSCATGIEKNDSPAGPRVHLCAKKDDGKIDTRRPGVIIDWQSAKHQVLMMHYCFEATHGQLKTARMWAAKLTISDPTKAEFRTKIETHQYNLDNEVVRLDTFMSLAMSQLERIRVKYRPSGFLCHTPLVRDVITFFSERCTPLRTAVGSDT